MSSIDGVHGAPSAPAGASQQQGSSGVGGARGDATLPAHPGAGASPGPRFAELFRARAAGPGVTHPPPAPRGEPLLGAGAGLTSVGAAAAPAPRAPPQGQGEGAAGLAGLGGDGRGEKPGLDEEAGPRRRRGHGALDTLDPSERQLAQLAPPLGTGASALAGSAPPPSSSEQAARGSLESLIPSLVRRVAWSGDARKGAVRMELGEGALAGGTLLVQADEGRVHVQLSTPAGADREAWRARIQDRLGARGLDVASVEVD